MKNSNRKYLLYLVIFVLILILFYIILSNKTAIIYKLQNDFGLLGNRIMEGADANVGLDWKLYLDYYVNDAIATADESKLWKSGTNATDLSNLGTITSNAIVPNSKIGRSFTIILTGFFVPNKTGDWYFATYSDDGSYLWLYEPSDSYICTAQNALVNNGGLHAGKLVSSGPKSLIANKFYQIRIQMGENSGDHDLGVGWRGPGETGNSWNTLGNYFLRSPRAYDATAETALNGLSWRVYNGYFNENVNFSNTFGLLYEGTTLNTSSLNAITSGKIRDSTCFGNMDGDPQDNWKDCAGSNHHNFSLELVGSFYTYSPKNTTNEMESWSFLITSDDASYFWIGPKADNGWSVANATINNGQPHGMQTRSLDIKLNPNSYYSIRLQFGELGGGYGFRFAWKPPGGSWTCQGTGYLYMKNLTEPENSHTVYGGTGPLPNTTPSS